MSAVSISVALAGSGGAGVLTAGNALLEAAAQAGWYAYLSRSAGPQIRGGESVTMLRICNDRIESPDDAFDILMAIDWRNFERFAAEIPLTDNALVLGDSDAGQPPGFLGDLRIRYHELPLKRTASAIPEGRPNMLALGVLAELIGIPLQTITDVLRRMLQQKGPAALDASVACITAGTQIAQELPAVQRLPAPASRPPGDRLLITGNEATGLGAVRGGVRFVAAYPITPATEILEWLAPNVDRAGGTLVQAEDELASINQIIGASFGGTPALTATSGPGLALMLESIGLAVAAEIPIVVVDVMRGGPSTGIPTKSEQADLGMALYGLHGDAPHLVLAPTSVADCLFTTQWAVHLAEALQAPAIVLSDQSLGHSRAVIERPADLTFMARRDTPASIDAGYQRYALTASGVSPMAIPGMAGGQYTADGLEHNPVGTPSGSAADHAAQLQKRQHKLTGFNYGSHWADISGEGNTAVITWGSTTGPVREALARRQAAGQPTRLIAVRLLAPAQPAALADVLDGVERVLVVEQCHGEQFYRYLRAHYDLPGEVRTFCQPGPLPIRPHDVFERIEDWL
jgi:2-oxoglutarate ferredoxin oxidoreductase subunit alpha